MKSKLRNLLLAAMAITLFASCSNIALDDASVQSSESSDKCVLTISYDDLEGMLSENTVNKNVRTIDPGKYTPSDGTTFKIKGTSARNTTHPEEEITFTGNGANRQATVTLEYDEWYLTLSAWEGTKEILRGVTTVDLKKAHPDKLMFKLSTKGVTTNGELELKVTGITDSVKSYTAGLYDINTDECKYLLGDADVVATDITNGITFTQTVDATPVTEFAPGSYIFKFIPYNAVKPAAGAEDTREDLTPYSDVITIAPGRKTTKTNITLSIMQKPGAPLGFKATLVADSETDKDDYYTVHLEWTDNSTNEENFVLRIYKALGTEEDDADLTAEGAKTARQKAAVTDNLLATFDKNFMDADNDYYVEGTLGMSTKECYIKLPTGHLYEFTLAAKNRAGVSDVCYREASDAADGFKIATTDATPKYISVNRQRITYNLMGGEYKENSSATPSTSNIVVYHTYDGSAYPLDLVLETATTENPATLTYKGHSWKKWVTLPKGATQISSISDYVDVMVYASYDQILTFDYSIVDQYKTLKVSITTDDATNAVLSGTTLTINTKDALGVSTGVWAKNITFTIDDEDTEGNAVASCDKITVLVNGDVAARDNEKTYTYSLNNFNISGVYNITVIGEIDGQYYSGAPIALTVDIK